MAPRTEERGPAVGSRVLTRAGVWLATLLLVGCGGDSKGGNHRVFFVGFLYDGASGARLDKATITSFGISYGDRQIRVDVEDDGRFISRDPLPTWQDYTVKIEAIGYRDFVSYNSGIDVPASVAMTNGVADLSTTQTLDFGAYLFPVTLKSPPLALTVAAPDAVTGLPVSSGINGTMRLRPQGPSSVQVGNSATFASPVVGHVWPNDEDLLTQTVLKSFVDGSVSLEEGELVYGVSYEVSVFDVAGYQPYSTSTSATAVLVAGTVTSRTFTLTPDLKDPLSIIFNDAATCVPPAGTDTDYGGKVTITFNTAIEIFGSTYREDFDNTLSITEPQPPAGTPVVYYCPLKSISSVDPTTQERGSQIEVSGASLIFSFNPAVGLATTYFGTACVPPPFISGISYSGASSLLLQPVGEPARRRPLGEMLIERRYSTTVSCPTRSTF